MNFLPSLLDCHVFNILFILGIEFGIDHFYHFALLSTALNFLHLVPISKTCVEKAQVLLENFVRLYSSLYDIEECTYNYHALFHFPFQEFLTMVPKHFNFCFKFVFEAIISHLKNLYSGTRGLPKQMVEKLGVSQTYRVHVSQKCKSTPSAARFAKHLLGEGLVFGIQKGVREADAVSKCLFCSIWKWSCPRILGFL